MRAENIGFDTNTRFCLTRKRAFDQFGGENWVAV